jgi:thiamine pyrophosphokinase
VAASPLTLLFATMASWTVGFLRHETASHISPKRALIILNQPTGGELLQRVWASCAWRACADGGANRLYDVLGSAQRDECVRASVCS